VNRSFAHFSEAPMTFFRLVAVPAFVFVLQTIAGAQSITLTFDEALARARDQAPSVLIARARVEEARGRLAGARIRYRDNPTIDGAVGPRSTDLGTLTDFDIGLTQVFETGGQRAARIAGAEAAISREMATTADATRLALRDVAMAFVRLLHAQKRMALLQSVEGVAVDVVNVANRRYAAGDIAVLDVNVAKTALARARAIRFAAAAERTEWAGLVQRLLGLPRGTMPVAQGSLRLDRRTELPALVAAVNNRPDLRAIRADITDAEADLRLGKAMTRPDVGIGARLKHEEGHRAVIGEVHLTLPVFARGQELQSTGPARASRLRLELETARAAVVAEVESLYEAYAVRQAAVTALEQDALPSLDENDALARRSFDVGQISLPELLLIRRELVETRLDYLDRLLETAEASITQDAIAGVLQ
jgi:outer membrane protein, heavy metal efflux system